MSDGKITGKRTLIEEGTSITGNLASSCPIVVMGKIEGELSGPSMEIAEGGVVSGRIKVTAFVSRGELAGELEAETVELGGRVRDETVIRARSLEVAAGGALQFGECELSIGDEPDKRAAIEEASGARKSPPAPERRRRNTGAVVTALEGPESKRAH
jgi:cytoskeletal protein CcmA (bactofilin family)